MIVNNSDNSSSSSSRKTLLDRLAALRIQSSSKNSSSPVKAPESPHFIPRSTQNVSTKSKFYNHPTSSKDSVTSTTSSSQNEILSSPSIGRRRKLSDVPGGPSNANTKIQSQQIESPIGISSPKYFPKQKVLEISEPLEFPLPIEEIQFERNHSAKEVVTSFIDSFTILNNFLMKTSNSTTAKLHLQNLNTSFVALQMDLKNAIKAISQLQSENDKCQFEKLKLDNENLKLEKEASLSEIISLKLELNSLKSVLKERDAQVVPSVSSVKETEEQLKISLSQIAEIKAAYEKEKVKY